MRILPFLLSFAAAVIVPNVAAASESGSNIAILGLNPDQLQKLRLCNGAIPGTPEKAIEACTALIGDKFFENRIADRSVPYLFRATNQLRVGKLDAAIADADQAAADLPNHRSNHNQRCWTRAYANVQLDEAMKACLRAIELGGASTQVLDSLGLIHLRLGKWEQAVNEYDFAGKWSKDALYGAALAFYGYRASEKDPTVQDDILKNKILPLEKQMGPEALAEAKKKFAAMGITQASIEEYGRTHEY